MSEIKCFDVVKMVVDVASEQFAPNWKINEEKYAILESYCGAVDKLSKEFEGKAFDVEVDEIKMNIHISLMCEGLIVVEDKNHIFYQLLERAEVFGVKQVEENVCMKFVFPSIWNKA